MARSFYHCANCGETIHVEGRNRAAADSKCEWAKEKKPLCWECQKAEDNKIAAATAAELGLPDLTGTPKQIAWAETIRQQAFREIDNQVARWMRFVKYDTVSETAAREFDDAIALLASEVRGIIDAHEWIERRHEFNEYISKQMRKRGADLAPTYAAEVAAIRASAEGK